MSSDTDSSRSLPTIWRSSGSADVTSSSTESSVGAMVSRRAYASSERVSPVAWRTAASMSAIALRLGASSAGLPSDRRSRR